MRYLVPTALLIPLVFVQPAAAATPDPAVELATLTVEAENQSYYAGRSSWGTWHIGLIQGDNCNTRCEIINEARDANGVLHSSYDGTSSTDETLFDVDHLVSIKEAHQSGGWNWTPTQKAEFFEDRSSGELRLVTATSNGTKSDKGPSTDTSEHWMPSLAATNATVKCDFIRDWIHIKAVHTLSVDAAEKQALERYVTECGWGTDTATTVEELFTTRPLHRGHSTVLRLYWAAFGRPPELEGAVFWLDSYDSGVSSTRDIARFFASSEEFGSLYGDQVSNEQFVIVVYRNVLGRTPDPEGFTYWVGAVAGGMDRGEMILLVSNAAEFVDAHPFPSDSNTDNGPVAGN